MRLELVLILSALISSTSSSSLADDPNEKFYELATMGSYENNGLYLILWESDATWVNGHRQGVDDDSVTLKQGDAVEQLFNSGTSRQFLQFRLDYLTPEKVNFTKKVYAVAGVCIAGLWQYTPGNLVSIEKIQLDLTKPNGLLVDYGPNHVELGAGITPRSKN